MPVVCRYTEKSFFLFIYFFLEGGRSKIRRGGGL